MTWTSSRRAKQEEPRGYEDVGTDLVRRGSVEELCGHRDRAIELYRHAFETLKEAYRAGQLAAGGQETWDDSFLHKPYWRGQGVETLVKDARQAVDRTVWRHIINATNLGSLMDAKARDEFDKSLRDEPAECTPANIRATVDSFTQQASSIFRRGVVEAFRHLSDAHKSNDGFKIGPRAIFSGGVTFDRHFGFRLNHWREEYLKDIDRCLHVLDGKPSPTYQQGLAAAMRTAMHAGQTTAKTDLLEARWHKSGSVHLIFTRLDLLEQANRLIAEHFGATLGAGHRARQRG